MRTALCDILGIEHPIIQGGMAHISDGAFAATVSEGGGLGVIQSGFDAPEVVREQIRIARSMTERPFAVNLIMESKCVEGVTRVVIEERVPAVTVSAGNPARIIPLLVEAGIITMCLVPHARAAKKMQDLGAAVIIAEGMEGGGHIGRQTTLPMVRQIVEAVDIPVVAAGGIADGAGFVAALALGAVGVQMGTAFLVAEECPVDIHYKQLIIEADDTSTTLTGEPGKKQVRCLQNPFTRGYWELYDNGATSEELDAYCTGSISRAQAGDVERGAFSAGMISGLIKEVKPAAAIIRDVMTEADEAYAQLKRLYG